MLLDNLDRPYSKRNFQLFKFKKLNIHHEEHPEKFGVFFVVKKSFSSKVKLKANWRTNLLKMTGRCK